MMNNVINLIAWKEKHKKNHWRIMSSITRHKKLSLKEALEYIAFAVWHRDLPDSFDGDITCEMNDDGSVEIYAVEKKEEKENVKPN
jgi:hypothetical protein